MAGADDSAQNGQNQAQAQGTGLHAVCDVDDDVHAAAVLLADVVVEGDAGDSGHRVLEPHPLPGVVVKPAELTAGMMP